MLTISLQSGSNGNCIYVEADGVSVLLDAGISGRQARERLAGQQREIGRASAVIVSHRHGDHSTAAGVFHRMFKLPIYTTPATHRAMAGSWGRVEGVRHFRPGDSLGFGPLTVHTLPTPHDAAESVAFIVEHAGRRVGILTDLGHPFAALETAIEELDGVYLESNYDPQMLAEGPYPPDLQQRIRGPGGHLSNCESAELLRRCGRRLRWAVLAHLSEHNNAPEVAVDTHRRVVGRALPLAVASRYAASNVFTV